MSEHFTPTEAPGRIEWGVGTDSQLGGTCMSCGAEVIRFESNDLFEVGMHYGHEPCLTERRKEELRQKAGEMDRRFDESERDRRAAELRRNFPRSVTDR